MTEVNWYNRIDDRDELVEPPPPFLRALFFGDFGPHRPVDCRLRFPTHEVELLRQPGPL